jgi:glycosyltransferase involved in cell wall biosynthesis
VNSELEMRTYATAGWVVAVSRKVEQELLAAGVAAAKLRVVHNGVDLDEFHPGPAARGRWQLPDGVPLALFVGGIRTALRNLDTILQALSAVPGLHLAVAGDPHRSPYPALAARLGLQDRVHFVGYRQDVADLMRAADFFVYPSRYEACSLVLLEAMSSGLPVLTAVTAGGSELLNDQCGWVLDDPHDVTTLAAHMHRLASDPALRSAMSAAARTTAEQHSWSRMTARYLDLVSGRPAAAAVETAQVSDAALAAV